LLCVIFLQYLNYYTIITRNYVECELEKKEGAQLHAHNCIIFSMADSTVYIRDDVCEPSDIKIGNI
jgi:hypothetical protein